MIGLKINDQWVDTDQNSGFSYNMQSPLFLAGDLDKILTSYSSDIKIPLTQRNKLIFDFPDAIDNYNTLLKDAACQIYIGGFFFIDGYASIVDGDESSITIKVTVNPYKEIKEKPVRDIIKRSVAVASAADMRNHAKNTAINPENYDHVFFPVFNANWNTEKRVWPGYPPGAASMFYAGYQNEWDWDNEEFITADDKAAMPFLFVKYVLLSIVEQMGFEIINQFQSENDLEYLSIYNNVSIYDGDDWGKEFNLSNHIPEMSGSDFLKAIVKGFALAAIPDFIERKLTIKPLNDILNSDLLVDWSEYAFESYNFEYENVLPVSIGYEKDAHNTGGNNEYKTYEVFTIVDKESEIVTDDEKYYVQNLNAFVVHHAGVRTLFEFQYQRYLSHGNSEPFLIKWSPLYNWYPGGNPISAYPGSPRCSYRGMLANSDENSGQACDLHLMIYRGYKAAFSSHVPFANCGIFDENGNLDETYEHSLSFTGTNGIFEKFWKNWLFFMQRRKIVKRKFLLPLAEVVNFSFENKIKVGNMNYLCNSIKYNFNANPDNRIEVEAELSTLIFS